MENGVGTGSDKVLSKVSFGGIFIWSWSKMDAVDMTTVSTYPLFTQSQILTIRGTFCNVFSCLIAHLAIQSCKLNLSSFCALWQHMLLIRQAERLLLVMRLAYQSLGRSLSVHAC